MPLSEQAQLAVVDRLDELEAASPVLYGALRRMAYLADAARLKSDDVLDVLAKIRDTAKQALDAVDAVTLAEQRKGFEIVDAEVMEQMAAFGYQALSDTGKLKALAARKRMTLREHGTAQLAINHKTAPLYLHSDPDENTNG